MYSTACVSMGTVGSALRGREGALARPHTGEIRSCGNLIEGLSMERNWDSIVYSAPIV